jgi:hypothetical protein
MPARRRLSLCLPIFIEKPLNAILDETVPKGCAGMIEDETVILARRRAKSSTHHLPI